MTMTWMKWIKGRAVLAALLVSVTVAAGDGNDRDDEQESTYAIGLWGDLPYSAVQATIGMPNLIADMNAQRLAFTVHDGDLKAGSGACDAALYTQALGFFNALKAPAMFTPGDNDWTDCDRNAGVSSLERLDYERQVFFSTPFSMGQRRMRQRVQEDVLCLGVSGPVACVENRRWTVKGVTYATLHVVGSCNNLCDTAPDAAEYVARNHANIEWLRATFAEAVARKSAGVMLITQGNPGWDTSDSTRAPLRNPRTLAQTDGQPDGFAEFLTAVRDEVVAFRRPVVYVHGDSHYLRIDKPFQNTLGHRLENFTRVETFGNSAANGTNDAQWLKVLVDSRSREVFAFQPQIVPGNRTAVPAP